MCLNNAAPSGKDVPCRINGGANKIYSLDFTPTEVGKLYYFSDIEDFV